MRSRHSPAGTKPAVVSDLALLAGGDGGQVFWRSYCRLTALFCRNECFIRAYVYARRGILAHAFLDLVSDSREAFSIVLVSRNQITDTMPADYRYGGGRAQISRLRTS